MEATGIICEYNPLHLGHQKQIRLIREAEPAGTEIRMSFCEILQKGNFYRGNLGKAKQEYTYISDGTEQWAEPHFTFYGFRYVKIEGYTKEPALSDFEGCVIYSDLEQTGQINTSDWRINRLFENAKWIWIHNENNADETVSEKTLSGIEDAVVGTLGENDGLGVFFEHCVKLSKHLNFPPVNRLKKFII